LKVAKAAREEKQRQVATSTGREKAKAEKELEGVQQDYDRLLEEATDAEAYAARVQGEAAQVRGKGKPGSNLGREQGRKKDRCTGESRNLVWAKDTQATYRFQKDGSILFDLLGIAADDMPKEVRIGFGAIGQRVSVVQDKDEAILILILPNKRLERI